MPSVGHLAAGLAGARLSTPPGRLSRGSWALLLVVAAYLPDADVVAFAAGMPYGAPFGHRGALHSPAFAALCGALAAVLLRWARAPAFPAALIVAAVMASHGILDAFTDGGRGVALLWPLSDERTFAPWRPIPVAPIGLGMLSRRGLAVVLHECALFLPLFALAAWPRRRAATPTRE